ncbi:MAG: class I adenylate cyclase [Proteobacteria bacterium]|nr:class I adenylate cyclase [Pseudomonadota bacterium]MBU1709700.1 class I adenylate cyclase [Pseudomonadota bacterium]
MSKIERYKKYNRNRKITAIAFNESKAALLFKIIPFLLHCNYPDLPGFVNSPKCPFGIYRFQPEKVVDFDLFQRFFPTSSAKNINTNSPYTETPFIHSLKTIGSIGTIAQTEKSDCDFWVSIRLEDMDSDGVEMLDQKCKGIEEWALTKGIEVYFFLMDIDQTRENSFESSTGDESAGSAIKALLKDELFRTHILVAGKMLLWWLIPPGLTEEEYRNYVNTAIEEEKLDPDNFIDLGYLSDIPKSEIFGACLWQMNKALDSPFKSIIKFAYLELLLNDTTKRLPLFSDTVKRLVTYPDKEMSANGQLSDLKLIDVDPYLLLAREIIAFYQRRDTEQERADLIRICMFLKTLEGMATQKKKGGKRLNFERTSALMHNWNLLPMDSEHYLNIRDWDYRELVDFGTKVHDYLLETYKRLRIIFNSFDDDTALTITQRDIHVLGRKLFTYYEKKTNKIDYIRSLSRNDMAQGNITFHVTREGDTDFFHAFQGKFDQLDVQKNIHSLIAKRSNLVILISWLLINGILNKRTKLHLTKHRLPLDLVDIQGLAALMLKTFPPITFARISSDDLLKKERVVRAFAVINLLKKPVRDAKTLHSTLITQNSWGEYFYENFDTLNQLKNAIRTLLSKHFVSRFNKNLEVYIPPQKEQHLIKTLVFQ